LNSSTTSAGLYSAPAFQCRPETLFPVLPMAKIEGWLTSNLPRRNANLIKSVPHVTNLSKCSDFAAKLTHYLILLRSTGNGQIVEKSQWESPEPALNCF
jgi:hypothetical protein